MVIIMFRFRFGEANSVSQVNDYPAACAATNTLFLAQRCFSGMGRLARLGIAMQSDDWKAINGDLS